MRPIAIFYHCLFFRPNNGEMLEHAIAIISEQMALMKLSGLEDAASEIYCGINGGTESDSMARAILPDKAVLSFNGLQCCNENRTIQLIEDWLPGHPGYDVLYFHSKGATRGAGDVVGGKWRQCMMSNLVWNWERCVKDLARGFDSVGCHWLSGHNNPVGNSIWAGNFWWAKSEFLATLPRIETRDRIARISGIDSIDSRFEAEVWIGNGTSLPTVMDYHPGGPWNCNP